MKMEKEELQELRGELERLTAFIRGVEGDSLPYFYHCFDAMNNNIKIYFYVGSEDGEDLFPVLERDWTASHRMFIGVQHYDIRKEHPGADPELCFYFARLLAGVGRHFERTE